MSAALGSAAACASSPSTGTFTEIDRERLKALIAREREIYAKTHPKSAELYSKANHLFGRVPMVGFAGFRSRQGSRRNYWLPGSSRARPPCSRCPRRRG